MKKKKHKQIRGDSNTHGGWESIGDCIPTGEIVIGQRGVK